MIEYQIIHYAENFLRVPYKWGGDDPIHGFDCSGLVTECFQALGVIKHGRDYNAQGIYNLVKPYDLENVGNPGALAFFGENLVSIIHVGICMDDKLMIEAGGGGRDVNGYLKAAERNAFVRIRPIKYRKDFLCIVRPDYDRIIQDSGGN